MKGRILRIVRWILGGLPNLALAVVSMTFVLVAFEFGAREFAPGWAPPAGDRQFWTFDPRLGWRHRPGQTGLHRHRDFEVDVQIGPHGLRDRLYAKERTPGRPRMLWLGDSFGWGHGVEEEQIASERLEARHPDWEIINASVSGYGTDQQLLWFLDEGVTYAPDVVLLLFHPNDFLDNHRWSRYGYRKPVFELDGHEHETHPEGGLQLTRLPVQRRDWSARLDRWLYLRSYLYPRLLELPDILAEVRVALTGPARTAPAPAPGSAAPEPSVKKKGWELEDEHLELTRRLLHRLDREVAKAGAKLVVVSVPMPAHLRQLVQEFLAEVEVPHLALEAAFARARRGAPEEPLSFRHDPHWTPAGQRVAADAIEGFLIQQGILARSHASPVAPGARDQ